MPSITGYSPAATLPAARPAESPPRPQDTLGVNTAAQARLQAQISQQVASAAPGADVAVQYRYSAGPDGQLVISGATVTVTQETTGNAIPTSGTRRPTNLADRVAATQDIVDIGNNNQAEQAGLSANERELLRRLQAADIAVRRHEGLHFRAAAGLGQSPDYSTVQGPDGRFYAVAGSVSVSTTRGADPDQAAREAQTLQLAATAPGDASAQDLAAAKSIGRSAPSGREANNSTPQKPGSLIDISA